MSVRQGLVYIGVLDDLFEDDDSTEEYVKYGQLINELTRGGLKVPTDSLVYFTYFCYMAFVLPHAVQPTCQKNYIELKSIDILAGFSQIFS